MKNINKYLRNSSFLVSFGIIGLFLISVYCIFWAIYYKVLHGNYDIVLLGKQDLQQYTIYSLIIQTMIVGPIIETFISQKGLYWLLTLSRWFKRHKCWIVILGAVVFGFMHFFTLSHVIIATINGFVFMYAYVIKRYKKGYWLTVSLHALINCVAIVLGYFE